MKIKRICTLILLLSLFSISSFSKKNIFEQKSYLIHTINTMNSEKELNIDTVTDIITTISPDTFLINYFNQRNMERKGISTDCLNNSKTPAYSRIFFERKETSQFLFQDNYSSYSKEPNSFNFINTKTPYSNFSYQKIGNTSKTDKEYLQTFLTFNVGKKFNIGFNVEYQYAYSFYKSQPSKYTDQTFFGNYLSDHHQIYYFVNFNNYTHSESGKIINNKHNIFHPKFLNTKKTTNNNFVLYLNDTWNKLNGSRFYFNYNYNFEFYRKYNTENLNKKICPISNITYTLDCQSIEKRFYTYDSTSVANFYADKKDLFKQQKYINDYTCYHSISNTLSIIMLKKLPYLKKFNLTIFLTQEIRLFNIIDTVNNRTQQLPLYIGEKLTKQINKFFLYNIQSAIGISGYNRNDLKFNTNIVAHIPFLKDTISFMLYTYINHLSPTYYETHYSSRYFYWNKNFNKVKKQHIGNILYIPHTETKVQLQFENITDYIFFNKKGIPQSYSGNIQIFSADLIQNFNFNVFHFDIQITKQLSSNQKIIPLPTFSIYSSTYIQFKIANTLTVQTGTNIHFWENYYAYLYEPAIQQFKLQDKFKVGNYPLINGYLNCKFKQIHFFIEYYNIGSKFRSNPNYFSIPNYTINPPIIKLGFSVTFIN